MVGELRSVTQCLGELGNQEFCKEWSGRCCWCSLLLSVPPLPLRTRAEAGRISTTSQIHPGQLCWSPARPQGCSSVPQQCVHALGTGTSCPGRALERAVPQGREQLLLAQPSLALRACCVQPQHPGHLC